MNEIYNLALLVEYDGSKFYGFQKQLATRTIQGVLETALSKFASATINIITSGRTDTGVHATHQVINFITAAKRPLHAWIRGTNALLPKDIVIRNALFVDGEFNARFSAISRTYHYYLLVDPIRSAIMQDRVGWYYHPLNVALMNEAGQYLLGEQDFSSFRASDCQANSPIRNLSHFAIASKGNIIRFEFTANAFLYHMVRNMVGGLLYVGNDKMSIAEFANLIKSCKRTLAPPTFMPDGLYLVDVKYKTQLFKHNVSEWLV